jgi:hypothetical protein
MLADVCAEYFNGLLEIVTAWEVYVKYNSSGVFAQLLSVRFQFINANF